MRVFLYQRLGWRTVGLLAAVGLLTQTAQAYNGNLLYVFGDIKRPLAGLQGQITLSNYQAIIDGISSNLNCNGIRVYIDSNITADNYPSIYGVVYQYARSKGLKIYANPLEGAGTSFNDQQYAAWIVDYANIWQPDYLGVFNESGLAASDLEQIVAMVRGNLTYDPVIVGPDAEHVDDCTTKIAKPALDAAFDIIGSHNAASDNSATSGNWSLLQQTAGKTTWSTENPRPWSFLRTSDNQEIGIKAVVDSVNPISGLVIYLAYPSCLDDNGNLTAMGQGIVAGIGTPPVSPIFATSPADAFIAVGQSASFTATAGGNPAPTYQWEFLPLGTSTWNVLTDNSSITGSASANLTVSTVNLTMSGTQFRNVATNVAGTTTSTAASLSVASSPAKLAWLQTGFTSADLENPVISGDNADPAGDGIPNLLKYAFDLPPKTNGRAFMPTPVLVNGNLTLSFTKQQSDILYTVEASTDLIHWSTSGITIQINGAQETASYPLPVTDCAFLHIVVNAYP